MRKKFKQSGFKCIGEKGCGHVGKYGTFFSDRGQMQRPKCRKTNFFEYIEVVKE